jgi:peptidyl-prolyl cis-trans isomerase A (cyclophilin A)
MAKVKGKITPALFAFCLFPFALFFFLFTFSFLLSAQTAAPKKPLRTAPHPHAYIETTAGTLSCVLYPEKAPIGVANFIGLANGTKDWTDLRSRQLIHGRPLYDGTLCHRVQPGFMIQCGDPLGTGAGGPGYSFDNETNPDLKFDQPGVLAYANSGLDAGGHGSNGSQFFITEQAMDRDSQAMLNGNYTIFGQCSPQSVELVKKIAGMPVIQGTQRPVDPVTIRHIRIEGATAAPPKAKSAKKK